MKYSYNWLQDLVDLKGLKPEILGEKIDATSMEVEGISTVKNFGITDQIFLIESGKTNRVDVLGHLGMAREISAITQRTVKKKFDLKLPKIPKDPNLSLKVDPKICRKYVALKFSGVKIRSSPDWLQSRLAGCGFKPINNVVDIANYVMLETGQPLHAFDAERLTSGIIEVRRARKGEKLLTLDDQVVELELTDAVIAGQKKVLAIAGIKGGKESGISQKTKTIILEAANFDPRTIRRTSWRLGLRTDAAARYEKNLPAEFVEAGLNLAIELLTKLAGGRAESLTLKDYSKPQIRRVTLPLDLPSESLGYEVPKAEVDRILRGLGFDHKRTGKNYQITVPFWRPDVKLAEDVVEELGRLNDYEKIPEEKPLVNTVADKPLVLRYREEMRQALSGLGFDEVYNYSFYSTTEAEKFNLPKPAHLELENPLSSDQELLRLSLLPNLYKTVLANTRFFKSFGFMEFGNVYTAKQIGNFHDSPRLAVCYAGSGKPKQIFSNLKGRLEAFFEFFHIPVRPMVELSWTDRQKHPVFLDGKGRVLGITEVKVFEEVVIAAAELDFEALVRALPQKISFQEFSKMPSKAVDLAIIVREDTKWSEVEEILKYEDLVESYKLFDVYEGAQIPAGKKSLAFEIVFQDKKRTLSDVEVNERLKKITEKLKSKLGASVR